MKLITKAEFLKMPIGTVYQEYSLGSPSELGDLSVLCFKYPEYSDFNYKRLCADIIAPSFGEAEALFLESLSLGKILTIDFNGIGRDGLYDNSSLYAVWGRNDIEGIIDQLNSSLEEAYPEDSQ